MSAKEYIHEARKQVAKATAWLNYVKTDPEFTRDMPEAALEVQHATWDLRDREEDYLPLGCPLLPKDFREFVLEWNVTMTDVVGEWRGEYRRRFKYSFPEMWKQYKQEYRRYAALYPAAIEAVKEFQSRNADQAQREPVLLLGTVMPMQPPPQPLPPLPPSPPPEREDEVKEANSPKPKPKRPRSRYLNLDLWPSPIAKVLTQAFRARVSKEKFAELWKKSNGDDKILTHDNCLKFLTERLGISMQDLLESELTPSKVGSILLGSWPPSY